MTPTECSGMVFPQAKQIHPESLRRRRTLPNDTPRNRLRGTAARASTGVFIPARPVVPSPFACVRMFAQREAGRTVRANCVMSGVRWADSRNQDRPSRVGRGVLSRPDRRPQYAAGPCREVLDTPLGPGLAALARMRRLGRPTGAAAARGGRLLVVLPPGAAGEVPGLLRWLGWSHLDGEVLRARLVRPARAGGGEPLPRPRRTPLLWLEPSPGRSHAAGTDLPRLLDTFAHACARAQLDGTLSREPSRRPHGGGWAPAPGR